MQSDETETGRMTKTTKKNDGDRNQQTKVARLTCINAIIRSLKATPERMEKETKQGMVKQSSAAVRQRRPWYSRGGMYMNVWGMLVNTAAATLWLVFSLSEPSQRWAFLYLYLASCVGAFLTGKRTEYCIAIVPLYMCSLLLAFGLPQGRPLVSLAIATFLGIAKVNICMSVCLHRYASHGAFQCGTPVKYFLAVLGCLANQGGPIWWASQHKCHHRYCDLPGDPHSPTVSGTERAFSFFRAFKYVNKDFAPQHLESTAMRVIDTWSFVFCSIEMLLAYHVAGNVGLFCSFTSGWFCQTITLFFNVVNHPPEMSKKCKATDARAAIYAQEGGFYLPYYFLDSFYPLCVSIVMEGEHEHHHDHAQLAKRDNYDTAYYTFILPLELLGLVWKVNVGEFA